MKTANLDKKFDSGEDIIKVRTGGCQCGEMRYKIAGEPIALYICHCQECQKQSASAFGMSLDVSKNDFTLTQGKPKYWSRDSGTGVKLHCAFCPTCGSRLWHEPIPEAGKISIKAGSLDESIDVSTAIHVWVKRKLPGIVIPYGSKQFQEEN